MLSNQLGSILKPLCYEHHREMRPVHKLWGKIWKSLPAPEYACQASDCLVRYTSVQGYFIAPDKASELDGEILPRVRCPRDGAPMYLGEVRPRERSFRLWRCPLCSATSTSGHALAAAS